MKPNHREPTQTPALVADCMLNVAATCRATRALGPGLRSVVWVQGCLLHCPGCVAPDWIPLRPNRLVQPEALVDELLSDPGITGLTISGGEPMLQAEALYHLVRLVRVRKDVDIICFTGFQRTQLEKNPPYAGIPELLGQLDVLIDGPYIARLNDNLGLRGSSNQRVHYLTSRLAGSDLENGMRKAEIHLTDGEALLVGVPPARLENAFNQAIARVQQIQRGIPGYEWI